MIPGRSTFQKIGHTRSRGSDLARPLRFSVIAFTFTLSLYLTANLSKVSCMSPKVGKSWRTSGVILLAGVESEKLIGPEACLGRDRGMESCVTGSGDASTVLLYGRSLIDDRLYKYFT